MMAELHGMFDVKGVVRKDVYGDIIRLDDKENNFFEIIPKIPNLNEHATPEEKKEMSKAISKEEHFPIDRRTQAILPYLPDPMAVGVHVTSFYTVLIR